MSDILLSQRDLKTFYKEDFYEKLIVTSKIPFLFFDNSLYKFPAFICSIFFDFSESSHFFILDLGLKIRLKYDFSFLRSKYPLKLKNRILFFWKDMKFLLFNSFNSNSLSVLYSRDLFYNGYFPLTYFNTIFDSCFGFLDKFSFSSYQVFRSSFVFRKRYNDFSYELDFHISNFFSRGIKIPSYYGFVSFYSYLVNEYFLITGEDDPYFYFLLNGVDPSSVSTLYCFFKEQFFTKYFNSFKSFIFNSLFNGFYFFKSFFTTIVFFVVNFFNNFFYNAVKQFCFFRLIFVFFKTFFFIKFINFFFQKFIFINFFIFEFFFFFFKFFNKKVSFFSFFKIHFKDFFFKFFLFLYFFFDISSIFFSNMFLQRSDNKLLNTVSSCSSNVRFLDLFSIKSKFYKSPFRFVYRFFFPFFVRKSRNKKMVFSRSKRELLFYRFNFRFFFKFFLYTTLFIFKQYFVGLYSENSYFFFRLRFFKLFSSFLGFNYSNVNKFLNSLNLSSSF